MEFKNDTDKDKMVQIVEKPGVSRWVAVKAGETAELDQKVGNLHGLTPVVKAVESSVGKTIVETKKKVVSSEKEILIKIKGVNEEIAEAILNRFGDIASAVESGITGLMRVPSIGRSRANKIFNALKNPSG